MDVGAGDPDGIERRLEALAEEMGQLIECGRAADREALHDYAVSLLRERLPTAAADDASIGIEENDSATAPRSGSGTNAATLIGYGFILLPASGVLLLVFPPVGLLLLVMGVLSMGGGVVLAVAARMMSRMMSVTSVAAQAQRFFGHKTR